MATTAKAMLIPCHKSVGGAQTSSTSTAQARTKAPSKRNQRRLSEETPACDSVAEPALGRGCAVKPAF